MVTRSDPISTERVHSSLSFIWYYLKNKKLYLLGFVLVVLVWAIDMSLSPYLLKVIVDNVTHRVHQAYTQSFKVAPGLWTCGYVGSES
jgi:ABC-type multidrug transport system fused ATPase/permease subunit